MKPMKSNLPFKPIAAILGCLALAGVAYYGNWLPLRKSQLFVAASREVQSVANFEEFAQVMRRPLDYPSPIGQQELVRNSVSSLIGLLRTPSGKDTALTSQVIAFTEKYYNPILTRDRGMSFGQDVYLLGVLYEVAALQTQNPAYFEKSKELFERSYRLSPHRPQTLYGLFDIYRFERNSAKVREVAERILRQWPNDEAIRSFLEKYEAEQEPAS